MEYKNYIKKSLQPMRPYILGEDLTGISVWDGDEPEEGGMIAVNPNDPNDKWYVAKKFFQENYVEADNLEGLGSELALSLRDMLDRFAPNDDGLSDAEIACSKRAREVLRSAKVVLVDYYKADNLEHYFDFADDPLEVSPRD